MGSCLGQVGLEMFVSENIYGKGNLSMKKCPGVHLRDNLAGNYSRDPLLSLVWGRCPQADKPLRGKLTGW